MKNKLSFAKLKRISVESSWIILGQLTTIVGTLLLVRVLTSHLTPSSYGEVALGLTIVGLLNQVFTGGISNGIARFWSVADEHKEYRSYLVSSSKLFFLCMLMMLITSFFVLYTIYALEKLLWVSVIVAAIILSIASGFYGLFNGIQNAARNRHIVALHSTLNSWLKIALSLAFFSLFSASSSTVLWAYVASTVVVIVPQFIYFLRLMRSRWSINPTNSITKDWTREIINYSWPLAAWGIFTWAQTASDRWALQIFASTAAVGQYAVLYQLSFVPITLASGFMITLISPIMFQHAGDAQSTVRVDRVYRITAWVVFGILSATVVGAGALLYIHEWVIGVFASEVFASASSLMPLLAIAAGFQACHHIFGIRIASLFRTRVILLPQIGSAIVFVALNALGASLGGLQGLVIAMVAASFLHAVWIWIVSIYIKPVSPQFNSTKV